MKAVLDTKPDSGYKDDISSLYHFPRWRYLAILEECIGDWVIFRRPRAAGEGIAYIAVGKLSALTPDPADDTHHYALISDFTYFDRDVPWRRPNGEYFERPLREMVEVAHVGRALRGKSVRRLDDDDFLAIVEEGFDTPALPVAIDVGPGPDNEFERRVKTLIVNKKVRLAAFRRDVCRAYDNRCAFTGFSIVSDLGHAEIQAAHILPVSKGGPDTIQNGLALTGTAHWLFDRHLISIDQNYRLLINEQYVPASVATLLRPGEAIALPENVDLLPDQGFLAAHRQQFFKLRNAN